MIIYPDVMVDIETMSTTANASIISIGAVKFHRPSEALQGSICDSPFYINVKLESCTDVGLHIDSRTVAWWEKQSVEAKDRLKTNQYTLAEALLAFSQWYGNEPLAIWANPSTFDVVILENAYHTLRMPVPWEFYNVRCYRTMRTQFPNIPFVLPKVVHDALEDATAQATHLLKLLERMKIMKALAKME